MGVLDQRQSDGFVAARMHDDAPRRKIGLHHLAFLRGVIQQPDLKKWWNAYLFVNGPYEVRPAHATLTWLRDQLVDFIVAKMQ